MQQTETYKLNLVEPTDPFSPSPLNENAQKTDTALADVVQRVIKLEGCRVIVGWYRGACPKIIDLGERPIAVLVSFYGSHTGYTGLAVGDVVCMGPQAEALKLVDNGFWVNSIFGLSQDGGYSYIALLGDWPTKDVPKKST